MAGLPFSGSQAIWLVPTIPLGRADRPLPARVCAVRGRRARFLTGIRRASGDGDRAGTEPACRTFENYCRVCSTALSRLRFLRLRLRAKADLSRFFWPGFK